MIELVLPPHAVSRDTFSVASTINRNAFEDEIVAASGFVESRRKEYHEARALARNALSQLRIAPISILSGPRGEPKWPAGVTGSITHCDGYCAAAVGFRARTEPFGIDAEPHAPLSTRIAERILTTTELERLDALLATDPDIYWDKVYFSAKESIYKAIYPIMGKFMGFQDVELGVSQDGTFVAHRSQSAAGRGIPSFDATGRWKVLQGMILTSASFSPLIRKGQ
jgi:4'-phosphopantetheinyl transferase EntD